MRKSNLKRLIITNRIYQTSGFDVDLIAEIEDYISNHIQRTQGDSCPKPRQLRKLVISVSRFEHCDWIEISDIFKNLIMLNLSPMMCYK